MLRGQSLLEFALNRRIVFILITGVFSSLSYAQSTQDATRLSDDNIAFIYWSRSDDPIPYETFASRVSDEYRQATNEFTRNDTLQRAIPVVDARLSEAREIERVYINISHRLAEYDFDRGGFPGSLSESTYIPYDRSGLGSYRVRFSNAGDFRFFPVSQDDARSVLSEAPGRQVTQRVEGTIVSVEQRYENYSNRSYLVVVLDKVELRHQSGEVFALLERQTN